MAFTTIQGSGANDATSFVGSSGVDTITINASTVSNNRAVFAGAQQAADTINVLSPNANVTGYTLRGGQGADTLSMLANTSVTNSYYNGNSDNDTINAASAFTSTLHGGQGNDQANITGIVYQSLVNGNKNTDALNIAGTQGASVFGGQGTDTITMAANTAYNNSAINGDNDNDTIVFAAGTTFSNTTIQGGSGNDSINGNFAIASWADSSVFGGQGVDTLNFAAAVAAVSLRLYGGEDNDAITTGLGADIAQGESGADRITNSGGTDTITAGTGADTIIGVTAVAERFVQNAGDSIAATTGFNLEANGTIADNTANAITFGNGIDFYGATGVAGNIVTALDTFQTGRAGATAIASGTNVSNLAAGNYTIIGDWVAGTNTFNIDVATGTTLLFFQTSGGSLATAANLGTASAILQFADNAGALAFVADNANRFVA